MALATLPTALMFVGLVVVRSLASQPALVASLASSSVSVYLDPRHEMNSVRTLIVGQSIAAASGLLVDHLVGQSIYAAVLSLGITIIAMGLARSVHPPAASTALAFALRGVHVSQTVVFTLIVTMTAGLIVLQRVLSWQVGRLEKAATDA